MGLVVGDDGLGFEMKTGAGRVRTRARRSNQSFHGARTDRGAQDRARRNDRVDRARRRVRER